jgi:cytochrome P450
VTSVGPIVRIAPDWVVLGDPFELRKVWNARGSWQRGYWYRGLRLDPYRDSCFTALDDKVHDSLRAKLLPGYNGKDVDNLHALVDQQVLSLVHLLETKYLSTDTAYKPVDLARKVQYFTLDVISTLAFGKKLGYLEADRDVFHYIETTEKTIPFLMATALMPWVLTIMHSPKLKWLVPDARNMIGIGTVMQLAQQAVRSRYGPEPEVKRDMLGSFVAHGLSEQEAQGESVVQIIAGSDTSATAIRSTMLFIMTNPQVYARFQAEIDERVAAGLISSPITDAEAKSFPYLQAIIREGIRMWPPATGLIPKVSKKDEIVCGMRIPAGTNVAWSPWAIMRNKTVFGDDAGIFRPERWLDIPQERWRVMDQTVMLDFGSPSRWECLGKNIAMIELNKTYVEVCILPPQQSTV